jgi:hypothetical protein
MLHVDTPNRDSLACDLMEPVRPAVDAWLLDWITREPLRRSDFFETATGNCRLMSTLGAEISETAPIWGKMVAPWAEYVARALWTSTSQSRAGRPVPTRLTQQHRRQAKGRPPFPMVEVPKPLRACRGCGKGIRRGKRYCAECALTVTCENFNVGRVCAQQPESLAKRSATQHRHRDAIHNWSPSKLPSWLTREFYASQIVPALTFGARNL